MTNYRFAFQNVGPYVSSMFLSGENTEQLLGSVEIENDKCPIKIFETYSMTSDTQASHTMTWLFEIYY